MVRIRARNDEGLVDARIAAGKDPQDLFEELTREATRVFGHYNLEGAGLDEQGGQDGMGPGHRVSIVG